LTRRSWKALADPGLTLTLGQPLMIVGVTSPAAISAFSLGKSYGDHVVLDDIDLAVRAPWLGPNGSGKTTTVRILSTLADADSGTARVARHDVVADAAEVRALIGVTGQFSAVDDLLTGEENLRLMADLHHLSRDEGQRRTMDLLAQFDLVEAARKLARTYSGGMRRRLDLAMTLMGRPRVIFLDELTPGLDPRSRREVWQIVHDLVADGVTIVLTTHYLDEADELADHIAVLDQSRIIAEGKPAELKRLIPGGHLKVDFTDEPALEAALTTYPDAVRDTETLTLRIPSSGTVSPMRTAIPPRRGFGREFQPAHAGSRRRVPRPYLPRQREGAGTS
jgi:ABC-2 type transport system ATP-binding protein